MKRLLQFCVLAFLALGLGIAGAAHGALAGDGSGECPRKLKVLMIGNSFSISCMREMPRVAYSMGLDLDICSLYIGGCSLKRHCENVARSGDPEFKPYKLTRAKSISHWNRSESQINIPEALKLEQWDVVTIQQCSHESWKPKSYEPYGDELIRTIRELAPQARIYVQETWSYTPWDKRLAKWELDQNSMYAKLHVVYRDFAAARGLPIIPMGTAVQNWRTRLPVKYAPDSFGGDVCGSAKFEPDGNGGFIPKGDVFHLNRRGEYLQALVWTATLFNIDVTKCAFEQHDLSREDAKLMKEVARDTVWAMRGARSERVKEAFEILRGRPAEAKELELPNAKKWRLIVEQDELFADWLHQDAQCRPRETIFDSVDPVSRLESALARGGVDLRTMSDWPARLDRYRANCRTRRQQRLAKLTATASTWAYARHYVFGGSHYAYTEAQSDARGEHCYPLRRSELCLMTATPSGFWREEVLLASDRGCYRDVDVSFDGTKLLYSFKASAREDDFHLYEMDLATRQVRQLTAGKGFADYEPCYLPDGGILFNSSRCVQIVDCASSDVSNLYRCDANGGNITRIAFDQVHDNFPTLTWDDRVLYTRWEYNDRSQIFTQPLFGMSLDGTNQRAVYGDNSWWPTTLIHARAVPKSPLIFAIATGHHTLQPGELVRLDPRAGRQEAQGVWRVAPLRKALARKEDIDGQHGAISAYPYPLDERELVMSHLPEGWPIDRRPNERNVEFHCHKAPFGLYWYDIDGARELLVPRSGRPACGRAVPVKARVVAQQRPSSVDRNQKLGTVYVQDVYVGEAMAGVPRGTVKTLRVIGLDYRPVHLGGNGNWGPGGGAYVTTPVSVAQGSWDPKIAVGDAVVESDGSVFFEMPSELPVYFMLLDEKGRMVQTMRSWTVLQPGENASCTGCHESKNDAPPTPASRPQALARGPRPLLPILDTVRGVSFRKDVQPILDARCVRCHNGETRERCDLTGKDVVDAESKRIWTQSYLSLTHAVVHDHPERPFWVGLHEHPQLNWICAASEPTLLKPYHRGSNHSELFKRLDAGHGKGITDAEIRRLAMWVDLAVPFCGTYDESPAWSEDEHEIYRKWVDKRKRSTKSIHDLAAKEE